MSERSEIDRMQRELGDEQSKLDALRSQHATSQESGSNLGRNVCFLGCGDEKTCFCWSNLEAGLVRRSRSKPDGGQSQSVCDNYPVSAVSDAAAVLAKPVTRCPSLGYIQAHKLGFFLVLSKRIVGCPRGP